MCAFINDKNCNYRPCKSFITQNHLLIYGKKHREKIHNTGKTQGILSWLECGHPAFQSDNETNAFQSEVYHLCNTYITKTFANKQKTDFLSFDLDIV